MCIYTWLIWVHECSSSVKQLLIDPVIIETLASNSNMPYSFDYFRTSSIKDNIYTIIFMNHYLFKSVYSEYIKFFFSPYLAWSWSLIWFCYWVRPHNELLKFNILAWLHNFWIKSRMISIKDDHMNLNIVGPPSPSILAFITLLSSL